MFYKRLHRQSLRQKSLHWQPLGTNSFPTAHAPHRELESTQTEYFRTVSYEIRTKIHEINIQWQLQHGNTPDVGICQYKALVLAIVSTKALCISPTHGSSQWRIIRKKLALYYWQLPTSALRGGFKGGEKPSSWWQIQTPGTRRGGYLFDGKFQT